MFKVLGYSLDDHTGWNLLGSFRTEHDARCAAAERRVEFQIVAVVLVRDPSCNPHLDVVAANVPHPDNLLNVPEFCRVATAL